MTQEEKDIDQLLAGLLRHSGTDHPSGDFTARVMQAVTATVPEKKKTFPRAGWIIIGTALCCCACLAAWIYVPWQWADLSGITATYAGYVSTVQLFVGNLTAAVKDFTLPPRLGIIFAATFLLLLAETWYRYHHSKQTLS